jgi:hypothetical protein
MYERLAYNMDRYCLQELLADEQDYAPNGGTSSRDKAQYWSRRSDTEERIVAYEWQRLVYLALADEPSEADLTAAEATDIVEAVLAGAECLAEAMAKECGLNLVKACTVITFLKQYRDQDAESNQGEDSRDKRPVVE